MNKIKIGDYITVLQVTKIVGTEVVNGKERFITKREGGAEVKMSKGLVERDGDNLSDKIRGKATQFGTRTKLLEQFTMELPAMRNKLVQIVFFKKPDSKAVFIKMKAGEYNQTSFAEAIAHGDRRSMIGTLVVNANGDYIKKHGQLQMREFDTSNVRPVNINSIISYTFHNLNTI